MPREIPLTRGLVAIVDDVDFDWLNQWKWFADGPKRSGAFYAGRWEQDENFREKLYMHRAILNPPPHLHIDHINGNPLDNRRCNLRLCTPSQNSFNCRHRRGKSSYKGVSWNGYSNSWRVTISANNKRRSLGYFHSEEEAARAYDAAARIHHGEFAYLNFPESE